MPRILAHPRANAARAFLCLLAALRLMAQSEAPAMTREELVRTVTALDAALFDAYNRCDLEKLGTFFSDDLEFYHDQAGVSHGRQKLLDGVRLNICGKVRRELVPGSVEVSVINDYGAVQTGVHRFHQGGATKPAGEAKFVHLWRRTKDGWRITRVVSYSHVPLAP